MLKKINRVLGLLGLKLIRPRRYAPKSEAQRVKEFVEEFGSPNSEWQNTPPVPNPGRTHYVGDDCPGGHREGTENCCIGPEAKVSVGNPNANFVPVDIGVDDHEINRVEQPNSDNKITGPTS